MQSADVGSQEDRGWRGIWQRHQESLLWCTLLLVLLTVVRVIFLEAPCHRGDIAYLDIASKYPRVFSEDGVYQIHFRSGMILPLVLLEQVFGYSLTTYYTFSIAAYLLMLCGVFALGRLVGGLTVAVLSTCLAGTSALVLCRSSNAFPDTPNLACLLFSFFFFVRAVRAGKGSFRTIGAAALCGFAAYLCRAPNVLWLICIPLYELLERRSLRYSLIYAGAFVALVGVECVYYAILLGYPLARITMIRGGVQSWAMNMPALTLTEYLTQPFTQLFATATGTILLIGGVLGTGLALYRRNWPLVSLVAGGFFLFCAYSYAATSFDPIRRALPLQVRYISAFTTALAVPTSYFLARVQVWTTFSRHRNLSRVFAVSPVAVIVLLQVAELQTVIGSQTVLFGNDDYAVVDCLLRERRDMLNIDGPVYALQAKSARLYPHLRRLHLEDLQWDENPQPGQLVLYSRWYFRKLLKMRSTQKRAASPKWSADIALLNRYVEYQSDWEYLIDTEDIVLARVGGAFRQRVVLDLTEPIAGTDLWVSADGGKSGLPAQIEHADGTLVFRFPAASAAPINVCTFPGPMSQAVEEANVLEEGLRGNSSVDCNLTYYLNCPLRLLMATVCEYDGRKQLSMRTFYLPKQEGKHKLTRTLPLGDDAKSVRIGLRFVVEPGGRPDAEIKFQRFELSVGDEEALPANVASRPDAERH